MQVMESAASSSAASSSFPSRGILPKEDIEAAQFISRFPTYDGRGVICAIFDTGVDPGAPGLQITSDGKPKIVDLIDASGSGDVDTSTVKKADADGTLEGLSGRKLTIPAGWDNPSGEYHIGIKKAFELYPRGLSGRVKTERKKTFDSRQRELVADLTKQIAEFSDKNEGNPAGGKPELEARLEQLKALANTEDVGPVYDCLVWKDSSNIWRAAVDTLENGDLAMAKVLCDFHLERQYGTFSEVDMLNYAVNIFNDGNVLSIVTDAGSHGTHVAGIVGANFPDQPELNGIAPGVQIVGVKIGDSRLGSMETGVCSSMFEITMVRAVMAARNLKVDIINMSYGEPSSRPNVGRVLDIMNELVFKHNVLFVASAGNSGPCLTTTGAPGGLSSGLISVGAVVTPDMAQVQYTIREPVDEKHYTWSSRGPAADGGLGVWISAPGGAIASVPNWTLQKNQLMNGTSMSSPNACGGLSVLLSALKSEERKYSADFIKRAIAVTGRELPNSNPLTYGHGMLQVAKAYDYIIKNPFPADVRINATTAHNEGKARGIYLREPHMTTRPHEELIDISPVFDDSVANADKIKFEMRINITCDQKWVEVPAHLVLMNGGRQFKVKVNPTAVPIGTVGLAFIRGYDAATSGQAPVFEVPVTVVQPHRFPATGPFIDESNSIIMTPGKLERRYYAVPEGATYAEVKLVSSNFQTKRMMVVAANSIPAPKSSTKFTIFDEYVWMENNDEKVKRFDVFAGRTLELVVGQFWSALGSTGELKFSIEFRGIAADTNVLSFTSFDESLRVNVRSFVTLESLNPKAQLGIVQRALYPTSSQVTLLNAARDSWNDNKVTYAMILTYQFSVDEANVSVITRVQSLSELLYDSPFESQFWMLYDDNKKLIASGDAWPEWQSLPYKGSSKAKTSGKSCEDDTQPRGPKKTKTKSSSSSSSSNNKNAGKFTVRVQLRHEDPAVLDKFKQLPLLLERQIPKDKAINLNVFTSIQNAVTNGSKFPSAGKKLTHLGGTHSFFVNGPSSGSLPSWVQEGDTLLGNMKLVKIEGENDDIWISKGVKRPLGGIIVKFGVPPKPKASPASTAATPAAPQTYEDQLAKFALDYASGLVSSSKFEEAQKFLQENTHLKKSDDLVAIQTESLLLKCIDGLTKEDNARKTAIPAAADSVIAKINTDKVAAYFGTRHPGEDAAIGKSFEEQKKLLIDALKRKATALGKFIHADADAKTAFDNTLTELKKWVDVEGADFIEFNTTLELSKKNLGLALKYVRKDIAASPSKKLYEKQLELLTELGWMHIAELEKRAIITRYPIDFALF